MNIISRKKNQLSTKQLNNQDEVAILSEDNNMCLLITTELIEEDTLMRGKKLKLNLQVYDRNIHGYVRKFHFNLEHNEEIKTNVGGFPVEEVKTWRFT